MRRGGFGWLLFLATVVTGCFGEPREDMPGEFLGDYAVAGELEDSSCGAGALGSQENWDFEVRLSRQGEELYWGNGAEVIRGRVDRATERFVFETMVAVEVEAAQPPRRGCTIVRTDHATGELHGSDDDISGFAGTLAYSFAAAEGSVCDTVVGTAEGVGSLPCSMEYTLVAERIDDPQSG
ncbi:MAG: hypothetical protein JW751_19495 [Polyangiaceae bacterium]|nr:hypothetical protein [Polyangiaceae bacterium]